MCRETNGGEGRSNELFRFRGPGKGTSPSKQGVNICRSTVPAKRYCGVPEYTIGVGHLFASVTGLKLQDMMRLLVLEEELPSTKEG